MKHMIIAVLTAATLWSATHANAQGLAAQRNSQPEAHVVYQYKDWTVVFQDNDGYRYCRLQNVGSGIGFGIILDDSNDLSLQVYDEKADYEGWDGSFDLYIDRRAPWTVNAYGTDNSLFSDIGNFNNGIDNAVGRFLSAFEQGRELRIHEDGARDWYYRFSLRGSKRAGYELIECAEKL